MSDPNIVVSSLKPSRDGEAVLRLYEASGRPAAGVSVTLRPRIAAARMANLLEDPGPAINADGHALRLDFTPFEIKTIRLRLMAE